MSALKAPASRPWNRDYHSIEEGSAMSEDKTIELITNLDRPAVEAILQQVAVEAKARELDDIIMLLGEFVGMSEPELKKRVALCLESLSASPEHRTLFSQLELVELNLPNLK
jgi:hypothetical protein